MAQIISNEIPSWAINGVNKVYTLSVVWHSIISLSVDWVEYYDFTFVTNTQTLTLVDAPTLTIRVDYIGAGMSTPSLTLIDTQDLRDIFYGILREEWPSSAYPLILCDLFLNTAQKKIVNGRVIHPYTKEEVSSGDLHFTNADVYYNNVKPTTLTADAVMWDTTLYADTTDYPSSWYLYLWWEVTAYTSITSTSFLWCTIAYPFIAWTQVSICYSLPANFWSAKNVVYNNRLKLPSKLYDDMFEDANNYKGGNTQKSTVNSLYETPYKVSPFYTIKDSKYLIVYQLTQSNVPVKLRYRVIAPLMTDTQWPIIADITFAWTTIPYLAVAEMLFNRWEEKRAGDIYTVACTNIREMYSFYNDTSNEDMNWVHYTTQKWKLNI